MEIGGLTSVRDYGTATLERAGGADPLTLKIRSVGSEVERLRAHPCWHAEPPVRFQRDKDGKIIRDASHQPVQIRNDQDPEYCAKSTDLNALWVVAYLYLGLVPKSEGGDVSWDADPANMETSPLDFFRKIQKELVDVGFSQGAMGSLFQQIHALSVPTPEEVEAAEGSFQDTGG